MRSHIAVRISNDKSRPESIWGTEKDKLRDLDYFHRAVGHFLVGAYAEVIGYGPEADSPEKVEDGMVVSFTVDAELSEQEWQTAVDHAARHLCLNATILPAEA